MKKLVYGSLFLALVGMGVLACEKHSESSSQTSILPENHENPSVEKVGPGFRIFSVQLHRPVGKYNNQHEPCNCAECAGFCDFTWFPDWRKTSMTTNPSFGIDFISENSARIYFFDEVDYDLNEDPVFYIDEEVTIPDDDITVSSGKYRLKLSDGSVNVDGKSYTYNSYIDVPYSKN
jgi:hypothetical protein